MLAVSLPGAEALQGRTHKADSRMAKLCLKLVHKEKEKKNGCVAHSLPSLRRSPPPPMGNLKLYQPGSLHRRSTSGLNCPTQSSVLRIQTGDWGSSFLSDFLAWTLGLTDQGWDGSVPQTAGISTLTCLAWVGAAGQEAQCGMVGPIPRASLDSLEMAGQAIGRWAKWPPSALGSRVATLYCHSVFALFRPSSWYRLYIDGTYRFVCVFERKAGSLRIYIWNIMFEHFLYMC